MVRKLKDPLVNGDMKSLITDVLSKCKSWMSATDIARELGREHPSGVGSTLKYMWNKGLVKRSWGAGVHKNTQGVWVYKLVLKMERNR